MLKVMVDFEALLIGVEDGAASGNQQSCLTQQRIKPK
jgi:hypothetical protein